MNENEITKARSYFPYLDKGIIYFNHAATGPLSTKVKEDIDKLFLDKNEGKIDNYDELVQKVSESKQLLAKMLNTTSNRIAFTENTSSGLNILAQGMKWKEGDRIILNDIEFPSNVYPFMNLQNKGVEIDFVKSENGIVNAENIIEAIKPETKLISVSYVQFLSGYRIDLEKLGTVSREKDIILAVDAIQGLGAININVEKYKVDFISCGTQKWLLGMQGMGFIFLTKELQDKIDASFVGWLSVENAWDLLDYNYKLKRTANRFQPGTLNIIGVYALNASLKMFDEFGFETIERQVLSNSKYFIDKLSDAEFNLILKDYNKENLSGIVSLKHDDAEDIFNYLSKMDIICAVREGYLRFAPHFYNTEKEIDKVVVELKNY
jgi:cysteine desulfurase/selenocysteine lyase